MSDEDLFDNPEARAWAHQVLEDLVPRISDSSLTVSIVPKPGHVDDVKFALELGFSIMLGKPIILAVVPGRGVPDKLMRVADEVIEYDVADVPGTGHRLGAAISRILGD
jgi:hypothetical protein